MTNSLDQNSVENQELIKANFIYKILEFDDKKFSVGSGDTVEPYPLFNNDITDFQEVPNLTRKLYNCLKDANLFNQEKY